MTKKKGAPIPLSRAILYFFLLACTPLLFVGYHFTNKSREWDRVSEKITSIRTLAETKRKRQALNNRLREIYDGVDHHYLTKTLGSLTFLGKEREALERLLANPAFTGNEEAEKRFAYLSGDSNRLRFKEITASTGEGLVETLETLTQPVEIDGDDLKVILRRVEGEYQGKPQLLFTDFHLVKKVHPTGNEVFELNLKLLKREFLK